MDARIFQDRARAQLDRIRSRSRTLSKVDIPIPVTLGIAISMLPMLSRCPAKLRRVQHLAFRSKKRRVRKKNLRKLDAAWPARRMLHGFGLAGAGIMAGEMAQREWKFMNAERSYDDKANQ